MRTMTATEDTLALSAKEDSIRWSPIFIGVLITLISGLIFNLLGASIGFSIFLPRAGNLWPLTMGTIIWLVLTGIISLYIGGWVAGRFSNGRTKIAGVLYGITVGSLSTIISLMIMITTVGAVLSSSFSVVGNIISASTAVISGTGSIVGKGLQEISRWSPELSDKVKRALPDLKPIVDKINKQAANLLPKRDEVTGEELTPEKIKAQAEELIHNFIDSIGSGNYEEAKNKLIDTLIEKSGKSREDIQKIVGEWQQMYEEAKEKIHGTVIESSKKIATMISEVALVNLLIIISGLIAAALGGVNGVRNRYIEETSL